MAEILYESLGSKNQHEELLDFHTRFDRELSQGASNPKILDIHSITKEPKNNYPELIKDLLDHIPFYEPFDGGCAIKPQRGSVGFKCWTNTKCIRGARISRHAYYHYADTTSSRCASFLPISSDNALGLRPEHGDSEQVVSFKLDGNYSMEHGFLSSFIN